MGACIPGGIAGQGYWGAWWLPPTTLVTDRHGTLRFSGFLGDYTLSIGAQEVTFRLDMAGPTAFDLHLDDRGTRTG